MTRLFIIQVRGHDVYASRLDRQYTPNSSSEAIAVRGNIYFEEKGGDIISAATVKESFFVEINPSLIEKPDIICEKINEVVPLDKEMCEAQARKEDDSYEIVLDKISFEEAEKIKKIGKVGLYAPAKSLRFYPGGSLASQVLGFVGYKGDTLLGRYGLEQYYEDVLRGKKESLNEGGSFASLFWDLGRDFLGDEVLVGHDVILTIEPRVQSLLENALAEIVEEWDADSAGGLIIDPQTGVILAMSGKPDFNPNEYGKVEDISYFRNPLVSSIFEMGSIMKPLTLASSMDAGKITAETTYYDSGYVVFNNKRIENYDGKARGRVDMQAVLSESLNTGAVFAMQELGKKNFLDYLKSFGFDETTGIDLPDEVEGKISNLDSMRDIEYATASFGHGIAVSPIEFAMAVSSLANGGYLMEPSVVKKIQVDGGQDSVTEPITRRQVLKSETTKEITRMLVEVVDDALLGGTVKLDRYSLAAKTGTAQLNKPILEGGGYYDDQYFHSFFGYGPASDSKFLIFLYVKKPQGVRYASETLTEPFIDLMKFLFNYYQIPPDR
ncbi:peptidoglycan D,D-transpeptidase FtsI family protein [Patescibacteria group bacterium]